jgi:hypothetical protein
VASLRYGYDDGDAMVYSQAVTVRRSRGVLGPRP